MVLKEYLEMLLGNKNARKLLKELKQNKTIVVTGSAQTGKTTLVSVLRKHGYKAVEDIHQAYIVQLDKKLNEDEMINCFREKIS